MYTKLASDSHYWRFLRSSETMHDDDLSNFDMRHNHLFNVEFLFDFWLVVGCVEPVSG